MTQIAGSRIQSPDGSSSAARGSSRRAAEFAASTSARAGRLPKFGVSVDNCYAADCQPSLDSEATLWDRGRDVAWLAPAPFPRPSRGRCAGGGISLGSPSEPSHGLSHAQVRVQPTDDNSRDCGGTPEPGHTAEARRLPKPRVGSSSLSRATSFRVQIGLWTHRDQPSSASTCALRVPRAAWPPLLIVRVPRRSSPTPAPPSAATSSGHLG